MVPENPLADPAWYRSAWENWEKNPLAARRALAKAITLAESSLTADRILAGEIIAACRKNAAVRLGITGVPGVGKSTFIENFGLHLIQKSHRVAVLAIDPSSPGAGGGSILADKTRMEELSRHERAFVRPSPSGIGNGGVAFGTAQAIRLCEAAGFDFIVVETVGVGQNEVAVDPLVDIFLLLQMPATGDEMQAMKKGILEMAHIMVVHKADGALLQGALAARATMEQMRPFFRQRFPGWDCRILTASSRERSGYDGIYDAIMQCVRSARQGGFFIERRRRQEGLQLEEWILVLLRRQWQSSETVRELRAVINNSGEDNRETLAARMLEKFHREMSGN